MYRFLTGIPHTKYMGPDPHTKSMTHTNCVEFARFLQKCHTKCWGSHKMYCRHTKHTTFFTRELCMGGGHSCHDSVERRFCGLRSECIIIIIIPNP